ncbi:hypothetical protein Y1Q_0009543 [Alligator mississippiensis]|uniref:Uncharacterized protein n=1 Tax=Alligator mississippiensis TaxID=8496 RepID=A0A151NUA0_ALLMI|nr:hypothetical protein Y1Q_0009543 [Alligator mississippiensis]
MRWTAAFDFQGLIPDLAQDLSSAGVWLLCQDCMRGPFDLHLHKSPLEVGAGKCLLSYKDLCKDHIKDSGPTRFENSLSMLYITHNHRKMMHHKRRVSRDWLSC